MVFLLRTIGVALAIACGASGVAAQGSAVVTTPSTSAVDPQYEQGFRDALNRTPHRGKAARDARYDEGYREGEVQRNVLASRGPDYELGYRDGLDHRPPRGKYSLDQAYGKGYREGESRWRASSNLAGNAAYQAGYRDGKDNRPRRYDERSNPTYAQGYRAGQQAREPSWLDKGLPNPTDR